MRTILIASVLALGFGLIATQASIAAPAGGVLAQIAGESMVQQARYVRHHGRICYRKCYREFLVGPRVCRMFC
jgi:hypothetical protein